MLLYICMLAITINIHRENVKLLLIVLLAEDELSLFSIENLPAPLVKCVNYTAVISSSIL